MDDTEDKTVNLSRTAPLHAPGGGFEKGQILVSKYRVIAPLGSGGMGTVYRVQHISLNKEFALKTLDSQEISDIAMMRFQIEARAASLLDHPNLVKVHDFGLLENGEPFLVMDIVRGVTLADRLEKSGPLDIPIAARLFAQVCLGLSYAHEKGVVHRDMKPSNIMLVDGAELGTEGSVKVVDFGIAKLTVNEDGAVQALTRTGEIFGSPLYMSPEQCSGAKVDYRSDIYSVGCVLFEALTGAPPHLGQNAFTTMLLHQSEPAASLSQASLGKTFPLALEQIVAKMLEKTPADRYSNIGLVALDLSAVGGESAKAPSRFARVAPIAKVPASLFNRQSMFLAILTAATSVACAAGLIGYRLGQSKPRLAAPISKPIQNDEELGALESVLSTSSKVNPQKVELIQSTLRKRNGVLERVFNFPPAPIGTVRWTFENRFVSRVACKQDVSMPAGTPAVFEVDALKYPAILDNPSLLWKLGPTEFAGLTIKGARLMDGQTTIQLLKAASTWPALQSLKLVDLPGDKSVLAHLNDLKNLRELRLARLSDLDSDWLAEQPLLARIEMLEISDADVVPFIARASQSTYPLLRTLWLENSNVSPDALRQLTAFPELTTLALYMKALSDAQVEALTQIQSLKILVLGTMPPNAKQLKKLLSRTRMKIYLSAKYSDALSREEVGKLDKRRVEFRQFN